MFKHDSFTFKNDLWVLFYITANGKLAVSSLNCLFPLDA